MKTFTFTFTSLILAMGLAQGTLGIEGMPVLCKSFTALVDLRLR